MPTPDPVEVWHYPNQWFVVISAVLLLVIWFNEPLWKLWDAIRRKAVKQ